MAKFYLDTEFHEYQKKPLFGKPIDTIELISIGIVSEDNEYKSREYYAICKDFDLKAAWNSYQWKEEWISLDNNNQKNKHVKDYWLRDNVLKPIFIELLAKSGSGAPMPTSMKNHKLWDKILAEEVAEHCFTYKNLKRLINKYGKTRKQIAEEVKEFIYYTGWEVDPPVHSYKLKQKGDIEFYAYYADYDWVAFAHLFGRMIDLPKGFPMYCIDLKQELERLNETLGYNNDAKNNSYKIQRHKDYPTQTHEHNSLSDAHWNKRLHKFLNQL